MENHGAFQRIHLIDGGINKTVEKRIMARITKERYGFTLTYFDASAIKQKETQLTLEQAKKRYDEITESIPLPFTVASDDTVITYFENYIQCIPKDIPSKQYQRRLGWVHNYISDEFKDLMIKDIDQEKANAIIAHLKEHPAVEINGHTTYKLISRETFYRCCRLIQEAFEYLYINEVIDIDPFAAIYISKPKDRVKTNVWTIRDFERITSNCTDRQLFLFMHLLFYTGLSINELLGLQVEDIHIDNDDCFIVSKYILKRFNKKCMKQSEKERIVASFEDHTDAKTTLVLMKLKQERKIPIPSMLAGLLKEWIDSAPQIYANKNLKFHPLFVNTDGTPLEDCMLTKRFKKVTDNDSLTLNGLKVLGSTERQIQTSKLYYCFSDSLALPDDHEHFHTKSTKLLSLALINDLEQANPDQEMANLTHFAQKINNNPSLKEYMRKQMIGAEYGKY